GYRPVGQYQHARSAGDLIADGSHRTSIPRWLFPPGRHAHAGRGRPIPDGLHRRPQFGRVTAGHLLDGEHTHPPGQVHAPEHLIVHLDRYGDLVAPVVGLGPGLSVVTPKSAARTLYPRRRVAVTIRRTPPGRGRVRGRALTPGGAAVRRGA